MKTFVLFLSLINAEGELDVYYKNVFACPTQVEMQKTVDDLINLGAQSVVNICIDPSKMNGEPA